MAALFTHIAVVGLAINSCVSPYIRKYRTMINKTLDVKIFDRSVLQLSYEFRIAKMRAAISAKPPPPIESAT
jgi:hypothetical protein